MTLHMNARTRQSSSLIIWLVIEMSVKYKNPMEAQWSEKLFSQCGNFQLVRFYVKLISVNLQSENCHFDTFFTKYFLVPSDHCVYLKSVPIIVGKAMYTYIVQTIYMSCPILKFHQRKKKSEEFPSN